MISVKLDSGEDRKFLNLNLWV